MFGFRRVLVTVLLRTVLVLLLVELLVVVDVDVEEELLVDVLTHSSWWT